MSVSERATGKKVMLYYFSRPWTGYIAGLLTGAGHLFIGSLRRQGEITCTLMFGQSGDFCEHKSLRLVFVMIHKV